MNVYLLMLCIFLSIPQRGTNENERNPDGNSKSQETITPKQSFSASYLIEQPDLKTDKQQYDPYTDRLYRLYLEATVIGVILSLGVIAMLIWQNFLTRSVAKAAHDNAEAAKESADALIDIQRAWIDAEAIWNLPRDPLYTFIGHDKETHTLIDVSLNTVNYGSTPGWISERHIKFEITNSVTPKPDLTGADISYQIHPLSKEQKPIAWRLDKMTCKGQIIPGKRAFVYGVVKYRDIFNKDRETWFGFMIGKDGFERMAHPEYNKNT